MFIVDAALEHTCAMFRMRAADGQITAVERDLLIDGAILLAANIEELSQDARAWLPPAWADAGWQPGVCRPAATAANGTIRLRRAAGRHARNSLPA